jgi:hypothetical protein
MSFVQGGGRFMRSFSLNHKGLKPLRRHGVKGGQIREDVD